MKLYHHPDCPYSQKVRVVLAEKDLEFEEVVVNLHAGEQKSTEFLKLNPYGRVPVLVDEDIVVYDSTIINEYLEDEYPEPRLMPEDSAGRARVRLFEDYCDTSFIPPTMVVLAEMYKPEDQRDDELLQRYRTEIARVVARLDRQLEGNDYLVGAYSLADTAFVPRILVLNQLGIEIDSRLHNVPGWIARLRQRESIRRLGM